MVKAVKHYVYKKRPAEEEQKNKQQPRGRELTEERLAEE